MVSRMTLEPSSRQQACDLCHADDFQVIDRFDRHGQSLVTVICRGCGLVSHERIPSDEQLDRYYRDHYRQHYHGELTPAPHRVIRAWEGGQWLLQLLRPFVPPGSRLCEVGAGIGCTVKAFEMAGFDATGIEPGVGFQRFAREQLRARVEHCRLADLPSVPSWDVILLVHVIEHFNSPRRALQRIHSLLRPGGLLYVECPNLGAPHAAPGKQFHFAHIHNFTMSTLGLLAQHCNFEIVAWLAGRRDRALRVLLRRAARVTPSPAADSYHQTLAALRRYSSWSYHVRPAYLADRLHRDVRFLSHHVLARQRLNRLLKRCQCEATSMTAAEMVPAGS